MVNISWHVENVDVSTLKEYQKNPRNFSITTYELLKKSIQKFGIIDKPFVNTDYTLIGGHLRKRVLEDLGCQKIDVLVPDRPLSAEEIEELCIKHNLHVGTWDFDMLANQFDVSNLLEWGFQEEELVGEKKKRKTKPKLVLEFVNIKDLESFVNENINDLTSKADKHFAKIKLKGASE